MKVSNAVRKKEVSSFVRRQMTDWDFSMKTLSPAWVLEEFIVDLAEKTWNMGYACSEIDHQEGLLS